MKEGENKHCLECGLPQPQWFVTPPQFEPRVERLSTDAPVRLLLVLLQVLPLLRMLPVLDLLRYSPKLGCSSLFRAISHHGTFSHHRARETMRADNHNRFLLLFCAFSDHVGQVDSSTD